MWVVCRDSLVRLGSTASKQEARKLGYKLQLVLKSGDDSPTWTAGGRICLHLGTSCSIQAPRGALETTYLGGICFVIVSFI